MQKDITPYDKAEPLCQNEAVYRRYLDFGSLVRGGRIVPNWSPDGSSVWYAQGDSNERQFVELDPATNKVTSLFDVGRLRSALREELGYEPPGTGVPFERFQFVGRNSLSLSLDGMTYVLDLERYELTRDPSPSNYSYADLVRSEVERTVPLSFMRWKFYGTGRKEPSLGVVSPDRLWMAEIENHNLVLRAAVDGQTVKLTSDGTPLAFWDVEGLLWNPWSPNGQRLAVFKQDTGGMPRVPVVEWLKPREQVREVILIPAGGALCRSELYLVNLYSQRLEAIDLSDTTDQYLRILSWLPDGSELILARYNRTLSRVDIQAVNALTGSVRTVLTEQTTTFLAHHHEALWSIETGFTLLPDASGFIWNSERSGWDHLYYYDLQGGLVRQLTYGDWRVKDVLRVDQVGGWVYFTGHSDQARPYDTHLYRVGLDGEGFAQLTEGKGQHAVNFCPSAKYFTDTYSAVDVPPKTVLRKADGTLIRTLGEAVISRLQEVGWVAPKEYVVKAADGVTDLWVTMYFPYHFDPKKTYPVVEYIYAGPQTITRPLDFGDYVKHPLTANAENFNRALANLGFVVVTLDARGTPGRSKSFQDAVFGKFGQFEIADHVSAVRQLGERLQFMDLNRVGIWGWSWGGQFAFRGVTQAPDLYKVGISGWPAFDLRRLMLYEPYLGLPQENPAGYGAADVFSLAARLKGELLLTGGMSDPSTQADLFKMSEILIRLGKQHRTMSYPYCGHGAVGNTAEYDMELKKRFFMEHLAKGPIDCSDASTARAVR